MIIHADTKIRQLLDQHPGALDAIVSIDPKFEKLRNPLLRKLMAGRTTISMAAKISGRSEADFYSKLLQLGFTSKPKEPICGEKKSIPSFITRLRKDQLTELDVRPIIASGSDPLHSILQSAKSIQPGNVLKILNSFEPTPLIMLLEKQGFETYVEVLSHDLVATYFSKQKLAFEANELTAESSDDWNTMLAKYEHKLKTIDVRHLPMPMPMMMILEALESLPAEAALFVQHKKIPVFLLPELVSRHFQYRINEGDEGEITLLIFKD